MSARAARCLLGLVASVVALALAEAGLGLVSGRSLAELWAPATGAASAGATRTATQPKLSRADERLGFVLRPDLDLRHVAADFDVAVTTNSAGLRDEELPDARRPGERRVLVLGDSFSFGWGVERAACFVEQLEQRLGPDSTVINAGQPGWSPDRVWLWMQREGADLDVDLVLVQVSMNDVQDLGTHLLEVDAAGLPVRVGPDSPDVGLNEDLLRQVCQELGLDPDEQLRLLAGGAQSGTQRQLLRRARRLVERQGDPAAGRPFAGRSTAELARGLAADPLLRADYLVFLLEQIEAAWAARGVPVRWMLVDWPGGDMLRQGARARLRAWFAAAGDRALDLSEAFDHGPDSDDFFAHDPHWTPAAHAEVGRLLAEWLAADQAWQVAPPR